MIKSNCCSKLEHMEKTVVELFAGVGGFRVGLNNITAIDETGKAIEHKTFDFVWANQWEPSTKAQHAFDCYNLRFPSKTENSNVDISKVDKNTIPNHTLLCGGFPCQDYSVARSLSGAQGIEGKKGVLWWQINDILTVKRPPFVLLENVDRLIKSPAKQRGRDLGVMLRCFYDLGYALEWRVINAADYGHPQRRRRVFIFAYHQSTSYYKQQTNESSKEIIAKTGIFAKAFPVEDFLETTIKKYDISGKYQDLVAISDKFHALFGDSGYMIDGKVYTANTKPFKTKSVILNDIVEKNGVAPHYYLSDAQKKKFEYLRGSKKILRTNKDGFEYMYSEGAMSAYDELSLPARTMLTSEGTTNRSTHIILDPKTNKYRLLTPIECERINEFPDNWTNTGMPEKRRYFIMGNALVCGVINKIGKQISIIIDNE